MTNGPYAHRDVADHRVDSPGGSVALIVHSIDLEITFNDEGVQELTWDIAGRAGDEPYLIHVNAITGTAEIVGRG